MKKLLSITSLIIAICCIAITFTGCGSEKETVVNVKTKQITVGYTDYKPMNYTENGVLTGFDTELALTVFNALGYEVRFKLIDWNNKYNELNSKTIDCIWNGFTSNSTDDDGALRSTKVDFTENYMLNKQCIVRKSSTSEITELSQFNMKSIAYELGSAGESFVSEIDSGTTFYAKQETSQMDALTKVKNGAADYAVVDYLLAKSVCGQGEFSDLIMNNGYEMPEEYYAIAFKKGSDLTEKVNALLNALSKSGRIQEIAKKYNLENQVITDYNSKN